jgi:hypothetical protein
MAKRRQQQDGKAARQRQAPPDRMDVAAGAPAAIGGEGAVQSSNLSLHELFTQQAREMIESADLDEEAKQCILIAMNCPCCGAGGMSYTVKLKRRL